MSNVRPASPRKECDIDYQREELHPAVANALSSSTTIKNTTVRVESKANSTSRLPVIRYSLDDPPSSVSDNRIDELKPYTSTMEPRYMQLTQNAARLLSDRRYHRDAVELRVQRESDLTPAPLLPFDYSMEVRWSHEEPPRKISPSRTSPQKARVSPIPSNSQTLTPSQPSPSSGLTSATYKSPYASRGPAPRSPSPRTASPRPRTVPTQPLQLPGTSTTTSLDGTRSLTTTQRVYGHVGRGGCIVNPNAHIDVRQPLVLPQSHPVLLQAPLSLTSSLSHSRKSSGGDENAFGNNPRGNSSNISQSSSPTRTHRNDLQYNASARAHDTPSHANTHADQNNLPTNTRTKTSRAASAAPLTNEAQLPRYMRHNASSRLRHDVGIASYEFIKHHCNSYGSIEQCKYCGLDGVHTHVAKAEEEKREERKKEKEALQQSLRSGIGKDGKFSWDKAANEDDDHANRESGGVTNDDSGRRSERRSRESSILNSFGNSFGKYHSGNSGKRGLVLSLETEKPKPTPHYMSTNAITQLRIQEQCRVLKKEPWQLIMESERENNKKEQDKDKDKSKPAATHASRTKMQGHTSHHSHRTSSAPHRGANAHRSASVPHNHEAYSYLLHSDSTSTGPADDVPAADGVEHADGHAREVDGAGKSEEHDSHRGNGDSSGNAEVGNMSDGDRPQSGEHTGRSSQTSTTQDNAMVVASETEKNNEDTAVTLPDIHRKNSASHRSTKKHGKRSLMELSSAQRYTPRPPSPSQARYGFYTMPSIRDIQQKGWGMEIEREDKEESDDDDDSGAGGEKSKGKKTVDVYDETFVVKGRGPWPLVPKNMGESMFAGYTKNLKYLFPVQGSKR